MQGAQKQAAASTHSPSHQEARFIMQFTDILRAATREADTLNYPGPDGWKQGRTIYGGLTASLCLHCARELTDEKRQLRSALISFVGPSTGQLSGSAQTLRSGRTAATVHAALQSGGAEASHALLTFSDLRDSVLSHAPSDMPVVEPPHPSRCFDLAGAGGPAFVQNFELIPAGGSAPMSGSTQPEVLWWARHKDPEARAGELGLLCLGDILPPAALTMLEAPAPVSSMTWMIDLLSDDLHTEDGWYLLSSNADQVGGGFSSQDMSIWNSSGRLIAKGRQTVTLFA